MIPEIENMKQDLYEKYGLKGVKEFRNWCNAFICGVEYANECSNKLNNKELN